MMLLNRVSDAIRYAIHGPDLNVRDSAGGLILGGPRMRSDWPKENLDGQVARAFRLAVVSACIDAIARDVSAAPLKVYREVKGQPEEEAKHPARIVVRDPNPSMSESEFWYFVVTMAAVTGFCVIEKVRSGAGRPVELWPLISPWLKVKPKPQALPDWEYRVPGNNPWPLAAEDVILVTYRPDPWGGWMGRTPMGALKRELALDDRMTDLLNVLFERGGVPPLALKATPQGTANTAPMRFSQEDIDAITGSFAQKYGGSDNWHKPMFLGGLEVERIGLDLGEMLFPQIREHIELHVCTAFGVPAGMIGTSAGLARNTYSNAATDVTKYYDGTIAPLWARLDGAFTRGLLREFDPGGTLDMNFDTSEIGALQEDEEPKWTHATSALTAGLVTLNQAQAEIGLPGFGTDGEVLFLPFSVTVIKPTDLLSEAEIKPVPAALAPGASVSDTGGNASDGQDTAPSGKESSGAGAEASGAQTGASRGWLLSADAWQPHGPAGASPATVVQPLPGNAERTGDAAATRCRLVPLTPHKRHTVHTRSKKSIAKLSRRGATMLRAFWRAQGERIVGAAKRYADIEMPSGIDPDLYHTRDIAEIDWDDEEAELAKTLNRFYLLNGETAFAEVADQLGIDLAWDLANPNVRRVMNDLAQRVTGISETTQADVQQTVADALDEGVTMQELADRLTGLFEETYQSRAMTVARTESQVAYNRANVLGYQESGQIAYVELLDNPNHGDYAGDGDGLTCAQRDGMVVPLEEAQTHIEGTHPNCILGVGPVLTSPLGSE
jgi:HK97 family phage portal protein